MNKDQEAARKLRQTIDRNHAAVATHAGGSYIRNDAGELVRDKTSVTTKPYEPNAEREAREAAAQRAEIEAAQAEAANRGAPVAPAVIVTTANTANPPAGAPEADSGKKR